jgi:hypothetical protein
MAFESLASRSAVKQPTAWRRKLVGSFVSQTAVRPLYVVFLAPCRDLLPRLNGSLNPAQIQTFTDATTTRQSPIFKGF